jgi:hypothetical protein
MWCDQCKTEKPGWVSVKDRLPKFDRTVLVCFPSVFNGKPLYAFGARIYDTEGWLWGIRSGYCGWIEPGEEANQNGIEADDHYPVTHWMPLARSPFKTPKKPTPPALTAGKRGER